MRSEQQPIDDFFRDREEKWAPGTSLLDAHWQQMSTLLTGAGVTPPGKKIRWHSSRRIIKLLGGFAVVTVLTFVTVNTIKNKKTLTPSAKKQQVTVKTHPPAAQKRTAPVFTATSAVTPVSGKEKPEPVVAKKMAESTAHVPQRPVKSKPATASVAGNTPGEKASAARLLADFYQQLEKPAQEFLVQAGHDTTLRGKEGTRITIASNSFAGKNGVIKNGTVKIILTEYYSYDDIVAAKLSTTSNGEQLVSGGMLHIKAQLQGEDLRLAPNKTLTVSMPTKSYDDRMQLFTGVTSGSLIRPAAGKDFPAYAIASIKDNQNINWIASGSNQSLLINQPKETIPVTDLSIDPKRVTYGKKTTARFLVADDMELTDKEIKERLKQRYGDYYDKIKIRRVNKHKHDEVIDSTIMDYKIASRLKLISRADSIRIAKTFAKKDSLSRVSKKKDDITAYEFSVPSLGWINCDRFLNDARPKVDFVLNLGEGYDARNFISQLVFVKYKSVMSSMYNGNTICFRNIPAGEPVYVVSAGVKDGKVVTTIHQAVTGKETVNLNFEESSPVAFRKKLETLSVFQ